VVEGTALLSSDIDYVQEQKDCKEDVRHRELGSLSSDLGNPEQVGEDEDSVGQEHVVHNHVPHQGPLVGNQHLNAFLFK